MHIKPIYGVFILVVMLACTATKPLMENVSFAPNNVVAHRGAFKKNGFPENSVAALTEAIRLRCTGSEFDVRMSADDTLLINHDPHYDGKDIEKTSYAELSTKPLANGEILPTLRQYLLAGLKQNQGTRLVVEIKPSASKERGKQIAEKVIRLVQELGAEKMVVYISFDYDILLKLRKLDAKAGTQYLNGDKSPQQLKTDGISGMDYHFSVFKNKPEWISDGKKAGLILNAWTVNTKEDMQWVLENKFDFITTNEPELLFSLQNKN